MELAESVALLQSKIVQRAHIMGLLLINFIIGILVLVTIAVDMLTGEAENALVTQGMEELPVYHVPPEVILLWEAVHFV